MDNAATGATSFFGAINDNAATAVAIIAIVTPIAIILPIHCFASFVARIISASIAPSIPTAITPFAKLAMSISPRRIHTPAIIPIAADIAKIDVPIFSSLPPPNKFVTAISAVKNAIKPIAKPTPFSIS